VGITVGVTSLAASLVFALIALKLFGPELFLYPRLWWALEVIGIYAITITLGSQWSLMNAYRGLSVTSITLWASISVLILIFGFSSRIVHSKSSRKLVIQPFLWCQLAGFMATAGLAGLEISTLWFNEVYTYTLPFVLIAEELGFAQTLNRWGSLKLREPASQQGQIIRHQYCHTINLHLCPLGQGRHLHTGSSWSHRCAESFGI
jgi:hypothetical protein